MSVAHVLAIAGADDLGSGRTVPTLAAVLGLISVVVGGLAVARSAGRTRSRRAGSVVALATGLISMITGALHAANSAGGFGTGNGLAGALVALVLGLIGVVLGGLAGMRLTAPAPNRTRRTAGERGQPGRQVRKNGRARRAGDPSRWCS